MALLNPKSTLQLDLPMALVDRLPVETLAHIFRALIALHHPNLHSAKRYKPWASIPNREVDITLRWLPVTHVSQRWRAVALHNALLWTTVYADLGPSGTQEMLARSKGLPLDVQIDLKHAHAIPYALAQNMSRVVHLDLRVRDAKGLENLGSFLVAPAPALETCHLSFMDDHWAFDIEVGLFTGAIPRLRTLKLDVVKLKWTSCFAFCALRELCVTGHTISHVSNTPASDLDELLESLSQMPNLQSLSLIDCLPRISMSDEEFWIMVEPGADLEDRIDLLSLNTLDVRGGATDIAALLPYLSVPATCKIDITYDTPWDLFSNSTSDIDEFAPLLQRSVNILDRPVERLAIRAGKKSYVLSLWTCTHPWPDTLPIPPGASHSRSACPAPPDLRIVSSRRILLGDKSVPFSVLHTDYEELPLGSVQIVDITDASQVWEPERWAALLSHMDDVRHIRVNCELGVDLAKGLKGEVAPRLETLTMADEYCFDDEFTAEMGELLEELAQSLEQRAGSAVPLETLYFQGYLPWVSDEIEERARVLGMGRLTSVETIGESP
ncbi:hypothetical protein DENSPDRAFT_932434 [Dentipellis sp. KUC8613]|nr:hypothetical protein DENSPDRAFT_932434 [Dentipellis sp. KUC8613]